MEEFFRDLRYGIRGLINAPGFSLVAIVTIALGIGVNSTIFSLVNAILLKPLPVERPDELVDAYGHSETSTDHGTSSYLNYVDYKEGTETLSGLIAYSNFFANLSIGSRSELVVGEVVSQNYFQVLGVQPAIGRTFTPDEAAAAGSSPVAILSHPFWQTRFAADPNILGTTFRLNGIVYTVIGVMPKGFGGMFPAVYSQMWIPVTMVDEVEALGNQRNSGGPFAESRLEMRGSHFLWIRGRMNPGVEVAQVRVELHGIATRLSLQYPETNERERLTIVATNDVAINPDFDSTLAPVGAVLLGAVALVLLVACANLANMMLARASTRGREMAVRLAIGASPGRVVRQLLTESMILALAGAAAALALSYWLAGVIARFQPPLPIEVRLDITPDWRVMLFTLGAAGITGMAFGLVPALRASRPDLIATLRGMADGAGGRGRRFGLRNVLVVVQVAISVVLMVAGALLVRSLGEAGQVNLGYEVDRTAYLMLAMDMNGYSSQDAVVFLESAKQRLEALPEVRSVGRASRVPLELNNNGFGVFIDGHQSSGDDRPYIMDGARVDEDYFEVLGLNIVAGRAINFADRDEERRVAVVTRTMADRYWPGENALGREFRTSWQGDPFTIVGIVEDYKVDTPGEQPKPYIHLPLRRQAGYASFLVATTTPAAPLVANLEREFRVLDPDLVFLGTGTMRDFAEVRLFPIRAGAWLIGVFGALALVLAAVGLYGVIAYSVTQRIREIGIRKALGAGTRRVVRLVFGQGMMLVGVGAVIGAVLAVVSARALSSVLFVGTFDLVSFGAAFLVLTFVAAFANWIPARRASRVDPMIAVKSE